MRRCRCGSAPPRVSPARISESTAPKRPAPSHACLTGGVGEPGHRDPPARWAAATPPTVVRSTQSWSRPSKKPVAAVGTQSEGSSTTSGWRPGDQAQRRLAQDPLPDGHRGGGSSGPGPGRGPARWGRSGGRGSRHGGRALEEGALLSSTVASSSGGAARLRRGTRSAGTPRRTPAALLGGRSERGRARGSRDRASPRRGRRRRRTAASGPGSPERDREPLQPGVRRLDRRLRDRRGLGVGAFGGVGRRPRGWRLGPGSPVLGPALFLGRSSGPSERGGLPAASARTASGTAGSTSQVIGRDPAEAPKSTIERSRPPGESARVQAGTSVRRPSRVNVTRRRRGTTSAVSTDARPGHEQEGRARPSAAVSRAGPERVQAEPVDAGLAGADRRARHPDRELGALPGVDPLDGVVGVARGDPVPDVPAGLEGGGLSRSAGRHGATPDERVDVDRRPGRVVVVGDGSGDPDRAALRDVRRGERVDGDRQGLVPAGARVGTPGRRRASP